MRNVVAGDSEMRTMLLVELEGLLLCRPSGVCTERYVLLDAVRI